MKKKLISESDISSATKLRKESPIISILSALSGIEKLNRFYDEVSQYSDAEFIDGFFKVLEVEIELDEASLENIPKTGPFITISNHPFGAIDGMMLLRTIHQRRPDYKVLANFLLQQVDPIRDNFIAVNPFEGNKSSFSNLSGLKRAKQQLSEGHALGIFPAGEVSSYQSESRSISDKQWMSSALKIIQRAEVPIVPIYFDGSNSYLFHVLGLVHPGLRTLTLPSEMLKKKGKKIKMRIGKPIPVKDQQGFVNLDQFGRFLRAKTYALGTTLEVKRDYFKRFHFPVKAKEIEEAQDVNLLTQEISLLAEYKLFEQENFACYLAPSRCIPISLKEIGRLREITFREVGEGTNKSADIDEYDIYYRHLFLWDHNQLKIAGAYRIGFGKEILQKFGRRGFYLSSLFRLLKGLNPILEESIELGRSFVVKEYQQKRLPLFLLWRGIMTSLVANPGYRYFIGPVSISSSYQSFSRELILEFVRKHYYDEQLAKYVKPKHAFKVKTSKVDKEALLNATSNDLKKLDKIISDIEPSSWTIPVLLKKYLYQNAKVLGFNRDPKFNDVLDGFIILDMLDMPEETISNLKKEFGDALS